MANKMPKGDPMGIKRIPENKKTGKQRRGSHPAKSIHLEVMRPGHHCIVCMGEKDPQSFPICPDCTRF